MRDFPSRSMFQDPYGRSALRRAGRSNPRNLPCPTCGEPNRLTPADKAKGYQCDECADRAEGFICDQYYAFLYPLPDKGKGKFNLNREE